MDIAGSVRKHIKTVQDKQMSDSDVITIGHKISLNSIQYIEIIVKLEEEFDIEFPDELLYFEGEIQIDELIAVIDKLLHE